MEFEQVLPLPDRVDLRIITRVTPHANELKKCSSVLEHIYC